MLKLYVLALLPLLAGAWSFEGHRLLTDIGLETIASIEFGIPLLIALVFVLIFLWDGRRLAGERLRALLPQLLLMCMLLMLLSLGNFAQQLAMLGRETPRFWLYLLGPLTLTLAIAVTRPRWRKAEDSQEVPALPDVIRELEVKADQRSHLVEFLRYISLSTGASEAVLVQSLEGGVRALSARGETRGAEALEPLAALKLNDLSFVPGLGKIPLRAQAQSLEILLPLGSRQQEDLYLAWAQPRTLEGELLQKLIDMRQVLATLLVQTSGNSAPSTISERGTWLWNLVLALGGLPCLLSVGIVLKGASRLIPEFLPWSHGGIPAITAIGLGYYASLFFTWTSEQRQLSQVWRWHRSQPPRVASLIWISKLRMIRNLSILTAFFGCLNVLHRLDQPKEIGPGIAVGCIAVVYLCFASLFCLPARTFGTFPLPRAPRPRFPVQGRTAGLSVGLGILVLSLSLFTQTQLSKQLCTWKVLSQLLFWLAALGAYLLSKISWRALAALVFTRKKLEGLDLPREGLRLFWVYCALGLLSLYGGIGRSFEYLMDEEIFLHTFYQLSPLLVLWVSSVLLLIIPLWARIERSLPSEEVQA